MSASDTPRTDALLKTLDMGGVWAVHAMSGTVLEHARQLERDLTALRLNLSVTMEELGDMREERNALRERLAAAEAVRWIPVGERLPEVGKHLTHPHPVLFVTNKGKVRSGHYHYNGCFYPDNNFISHKIAKTDVAEAQFTSGQLNGMDTATHWQPLPNPPSEG